MTEPVIRELAAADLDAWLRLEQAAFFDPWSERQLQAQLAHPRGLALGAFIDGALQAFALFSYVLDEAELLQIAVAAPTPRRGLAVQLLHQGEQRLRRRGVARLLLEVRAGNQAALRLYRGYGFNEDGRRRGYYPAPAGPEDAVLMSYRLSP